ncbi:hypothetical protein [Lentimicrobium sp. S6]|uniref:hypothetical protein n=1 Tax=Lentimicrobium sp. S6 TaxID=2735872 RepID=UPI0015540859|nr:hypothetical protein [Lentimicrobium sp. S6]NPD45349.1 hypothetical protein [Lentimicrobium sp. S6]
MKKLLILLVIITSCTPPSKTPPKGLEGTWLSVPSVEDGKINTLYQGYFMEIKPGKRIFQHGYSDSLVEENVTFTNSSIILQDSSEIHINYLGPDSLRLIFPWDNTIVTYVKLPHKESQKVTIKEENLFENEWFLLDGENKYRVDFTNDDIKILNHDKTFKFAHNIRGWGKQSAWNLMEFNGYSYLISTAFSNFEPDIYQVIELNKDTIILKIYDVWETKDFKTLKLVKSPAKSQEEHNDLKTQLTNHKFILQDYNFRSHLEEDTVYTVFIKRIHRFFKEFGINWIG